MIFLCVIALPLGFRLLWLWCIFILSVKQENILKEIFNTNVDKDTMESTGGWKKTVRHVTGNDEDYLRKIPRVVW